MPMPVVPVQKSNIGGIGMIATRAIQPELREVFKMALCACNPPVVIRQIVALSNPHILADPGGATDGDRQCTKNGKVKLCWFKGLADPQTQGIVWSYTSVEIVCHFFWFMTPCPDIQSPTMRGHSIIRLSIGDWMACFVELHWLHKIPWIFIIEMEIVVPNFGLASHFLEGIGCIIYILPWHMRTQEPWAHDSTCCVCCDTRELKTPGLTGLEPNRLSYRE